MNESERIAELERERDEARRMLDESEADLARLTESVKRQTVVGVAMEAALSAATKREVNLRESCEIRGRALGYASPESVSAVLRRTK